MPAPPPSGAYVMAPRVPRGPNDAFSLLLDEDAEGAGVEEEIGEGQRHALRPGAETLPPSRHDTEPSPPPSDFEL